MNGTSKHIAWYLLGALLGATAGALFAHHFLFKEEEMDEDEWISEEEEEEFPEENEEILHKPEVLSAPPSPEKLSKRDKKKGVKKPNEKVDYSKIKRPRQDKVDIATLTKKYQTEDDSDEDDIGGFQPPENPYIIDTESYAEECPQYSNVTLTYYAEDDVLTDEAENVIQDPERLVGPEALTKFGYMSDDPDIVYVRNDKLSTDYEVIRTRRSYVEEVLGIVEEKPKRKRVKKVDDYGEE